MRNRVSYITSSESWFFKFLQRNCLHMYVILVPFVYPNLIATEFDCWNNHEFKMKRRASLVAQWLRIRLQMQGTRVRALVREDPTCCGATKPVRHNY